MYEDDLQLGELKENCLLNCGKLVHCAYEPVDIVAFSLPSESW